MNTSDAKVFVPFSEDLVSRFEAPLGELVPFHLEYQCVRLLDNGQQETVLTNAMTLESLDASTEILLASQ